MEVIVAVFCNAGKANVPEFLCENKKRTELLVNLYKVNAEDFAKEKIIDVINY